MSQSRGTAWATERTGERRTIAVRSDSAAAVLGPITPGVRVPTSTVDHVMASIPGEAATSVRPEVQPAASADFFGPPLDLWRGMP